MSAGYRGPRFDTTRWTLVLQAKGSDLPALEALCAAYWYPLYAFVRRGGHSAHDAQDLVQEFFLRLLDREWLAAVRPERGKFRSFLLMAMKRFLVNEWKASQRLKRGGGEPELSLDWMDAEDRYMAEPAELSDPSAIFDRRWAMTLLERTLERLAGEQGEDSPFEHLKPAITMARGEFECGVVAMKLGLSEGAVRVAVHRLRKRYREILRAEIMETVTTEADADEELRYLIEVLARG